MLSIAMAVVKGGLDKIGETVTIPLSSGKQIAAKVTRSGVYDSEGARSQVELKQRDGVGRESCCRQADRRMAGVAAGGRGRAAEEASGDGIRRVQVERAALPGTRERARRYA